MFNILIYIFHYFNFHYLFNLLFLFNGELYYSMALVFKFLVNFNPRIIVHCFICIINYFIKDLINLTNRLEI